MLWFDVGIKRYTTPLLLNMTAMSLWFDVGIKRYTTHKGVFTQSFCCGLM